MLKQCWYKVLLVAAMITVVYCTEPSPPPASPSPHVEKKAADASIPAKQPESKAGAPLAKKAKPEPRPDARQQALQKHYDGCADRRILHTTNKLSGDEQKLVRHLLEAAALIEELYMLQLHPQNLAWRRHVVQSGTTVEAKLFARYRSPWCTTGDSTRCCTFAECPLKRIGFTPWPDDLTRDEFNTLGRQINGQELLSPYTLVHRNERGGFDALALSQTDVFGPKIKTLSQTLRQAARVAPQATLKTFLNARADALEATTPFPYDDSDIDWIGVSGKWEVMVGPYETYGCPWQTKAQFGMVFGREDPVLSAELAGFETGLQQLEQAVGALVGPEVYRPRGGKQRTAIRAIRVWMAAGQSRAGCGAMTAFHLPNRGKAVAQGLSKKVLLVNHLEAFAKERKARAGRVVDESLLAKIDHKAGAHNTLSHELAHGLGAFSEMKIEPSPGKPRTVKEVFKSHHLLLEELKANALGLWLVDYYRGQGRLDQSAVERRYTAALLDLIGNLDGSLDTVHARAGAIQLGWLVEAGAVTFDEALERFSIDFGKMPGAVEALAKEVASLQYAGDRSGVRNLMDRFIATPSKGPSTWRGSMGRVQAIVEHKMRDAGIKPPSLRYEVRHAP